MRSMKLEMVLHALDVGGMEMLVARLARALKRRGHEVGFTCIERAGTIGESLTEEGYRVTVVPTPGLYTILRPGVLEAWFRALAPDVVHIHSGAWLKAARAARRAGVPRVVHSAHGLLEPETWYTPALDWWAARSTDRVIAVSDWMLDHLRTRARVPARLLSVIHNGVDTNTFQPGPRVGVLRRALGLDDGAWLIGTVARLTPVKNHALLIRACAALARSVPEMHAVIVGDGPRRTALERQVAEAGLGRRVHFLGSTRVTPELYRDLDVFVLSSTAEGTSVSLLEALACGVCAVATAVGGNPEVLGGGRSGVLVPPNDAEALAAALGSLARDAGQRARLAELGRRRVVDCYAEARMVERYEDAYQGGNGPASVPPPPERSGASRCAE
jgi:glycosyltransferase involved in cell wall biosynthesis